MKLPQFDRVLALYPLDCHDLSEMLMRYVELNIAQASSGATMGAVDALLIGPAFRLAHRLFSRYNAKRSRPQALPLKLAYDELLLLNRVLLSIGLHPNAKCDTYRLRMLIDQKSLSLTAFFDR